MAHARWGLRLTGGMLAIAATLATTGCADPVSNLGGDRLPVQVDTEEYGHDSLPIAGTLVLESNGCWTTDIGGGTAIVVFPRGFTHGDDGVSMVGPGGGVVMSGDVVSGEGGQVAGATFPEVPDGYWGNYRAFCGPDLDFVVFDTMAALAPGAPEALPSLDVSWGCGWGFTVSDADQTVALTVWPLDGRPVSGTVTLPDPRWEVRLETGADLLANHCDDVVEPDEPTPVVTGTIEVLSGVLTIDLPTEDCAGGQATTSVTDLVVASAAGPIAIGDLTIVNDAYGCFAG